MRRRASGVQARRTGANLRDQAGQLATVRSEQRREGTWVDVADEFAEALDERTVGQAAGPERQAPTRQHARAGRFGRSAERVDEPGLPDPGLTGDDDDAGLAGYRAGVVRGEASHLGGPSDERLAANVIHDAAMIGASAPASSRPTLDEHEPKGHALRPAISSRAGGDPWRGTIACARPGSNVRSARRSPPSDSPGRPGRRCAGRRRSTR